MIAQQYYYTNRLKRFNVSVFLFTLAISGIIFTSACNNKNEIKAGSICTIEDGEGMFGVIKVLVINSEDAHVKIYKNKFHSRPEKIDLQTLSIGSVLDKDGFGVGHVPMSRQQFNEWKPVIVGYEEVTQKDLEGYEIWKNQ